MISTLVAFSILTTPPKWKEGMTWEYETKWRYRNQEIDSIELESWVFRVQKVEKESVKVSFATRLEATLVGEQRVPTSPDLKPIIADWVLFTNGSFAFMPNAREGVEERLYRIFRGITPAPEGGQPRDREWEVTFEDPSNFGALRATFSKQIKEGTEFIFSYREASEMTIKGAFLRDEKLPFPRSMQLLIPSMIMPGGSERVRADVEITLKKS